jgi:hypothetical protein
MTDHTTRSPVDPDVFGQLLLHTEQSVHRAGWDEPPQFRLIYNTADTDTDLFCRRVLTGYGPTIRHGGYAAPILLHADMLAGARLNQFLEYLALDLAYGTPTAHNRAMLDILRRPGVLGVAHIDEAWHRTAGPAEAHTLTTGTTHLADIPGTAEARIVRACDITGRLYQVLRFRGQRPELDPHHHGAGHVTTTVRLFIAAMTDTVPPRDQLNTVFPTAAAVVAAASLADHPPKAERP